MVAFLFCAWLSSTIYTDKTQVTLGENFGYFNSPWSAAVTAILANMVLSLAGFFLVKNTIERDEQTRVGALLATTPLASRDYLFGKCLSNFMYLMSLGLVFMVSVPFLQHHRGHGISHRTADDRQRLPAAGCSRRRHSSRPWQCCGSPFRCLSAGSGMFCTWLSG